MSPMEATVDPPPRGSRLDADHPRKRGPYSMPIHSRLILASGEVSRFHDPSRPYLHPEDVDIALDINRFDFAVGVEFEDGRPVARVERRA